jgi:integration host factor subunit beta
MLRDLNHESTKQHLRQRLAPTRCRIVRLQYFDHIPHLASSHMPTRRASAPAIKRSDIVNGMHLRLPEHPRADINAVIKALIEIMSDALADGRTVTIRGFGRLSSHVTPSRTLRNPKTGTPVLTSRKYVRFRPYPPFLASLNRNAPSRQSLVGEPVVCSPSNTLMPSPNRVTPLTAQPCRDGPLRRDRLEAESTES